MRLQVVYKPRNFSYDRDWIDAFEGAELVIGPKKLDADLIVILHSMSGQWAGYPEWLVLECKDRRGKLVIFHTNEFKNVKEREQAAREMGADFIATQLPDGRLYDFPTISMPHALNPTEFRNRGWERNISIGFVGSRYKPGINDARNEVIAGFQNVQDSNIVFTKDLMKRDQWACFLNNCKATPGAEAGCAGARIITPRHLEAIGCGTLNVLLPGNYCGVIDERHYLRFDSVESAMEVVNDDHKRKVITEEALAHVMEHHTYEHRIAHLMDSVW